MSEGGVEPVLEPFRGFESGENLRPVHLSKGDRQGRTRATPKASWHGIPQANPTFADFWELHTAVRVFVGVWPDLTTCGAVVKTYPLEAAP